MNKFVTVPGAIDRPIVASRFTSNRIMRPIEESHVPVGESVAKVYPWITGFKKTIPGTVGSEIRLVRDDLGSAALVNNTGRTLKIHEIRFFSTLPTTADDPVASLGNFQISYRMGVKIRHSDYDIVAEWLPSGMLQTHNGRIGIAARSDLVMTLPTPYYLQAGHPFRIRIRSTNPYQEADTDYNFGITLFGMDPKVHKPYEICSQVTMPYLTAATPTDAAPQYVDVVFDDGRDYPMRDMLLTHIGFGLFPRADTTTRILVYNYAQQLEVQLQAPEGPKWMEFADWAPIPSIVDQGTIPVDGSYVMYKPEVPMILTPSQQIDIDVKALVNMAYITGGEGEVPGDPVFEVPLWTTLIGTQEQEI
jgi:hypothetical protein